MRSQPIPQRIPPLAWRRPAFVWTPLALALAIGWPAALFYDDRAPQRLAISILFAVFALALISLGVSWMLGRAPKSRRVVVMHVVVAGAIAALAAPLVLTSLLQATAGEDSGGFSTAMSLTMTPLVVVLGLPVVLLSGILFAWIALRRPPSTLQTQADQYRHDVQPFR